MTKELTPADKRRQTNIAKYGSYEAWCKSMAERAKQAKHLNHRGGFNVMDKETLREVAIKAGQASGVSRRRKNEVRED